MANLDQAPSRSMPNLLHVLPAFADEAELRLNTIVELNSNTINKYELITETGHLKLDRVGYSSLAYPFAYGCIPRTWDEDGDPLDIEIVNVTEPLIPGSIVEARIIGIMTFDDGGEVDDKVIAPCLLGSGTWEPVQTKIVISMLSAGQNVIDIGANIGYYTLLCSKLTGERGKVFSFEPEPRNFSILRANVSLNNLTNVVLENKAISNSEGSSYLYLSAHNKGDHRLAFEPHRERCMVEHLPLDDYLRGFESEIHFLKCDVQGHELKVLRGMQKMIESNLDHLCCMIEFSPGLLEREEASSLEAFLDFFNAYQAEIYWIKEKSGQPDLVPVDKTLLRKLGAEMIKVRKVDFSNDLLIFFSANARAWYFDKMGDM